MSIVFSERLPISDAQLTTWVGDAECWGEDGETIVVGDPSLTDPSEAFERMKPVLEELEEVGYTAHDVRRGSLQYGIVASYSDGEEFEAGTDDFMLHPRWDETDTLARMIFYIDLSRSPIPAPSPTVDPDDELDGVVLGPACAKQGEECDSCS